MAETLNITDPNGRLADLARFVMDEIADFYLDPELTPLNRRRAMELQKKASELAHFLPGFTEMPDAKRAREEASVA